MWMRTLPRSFADSGFTSVPLCLRARYPLCFRWVWRFCQNRLACQFRRNWHTFQILFSRTKTQSRKGNPFLSTKHTKRHKKQIHFHHEEHEGNEDNTYSQRMNADTAAFIRWLRFYLRAFVSPCETSPCFHSSSVFKYGGFAKTALLASFGETGILSKSFFVHKTLKKTQKLRKN